MKTIEEAIRQTREVASAVFEDCPFSSQRLDEVAQFLETLTEEHGWIDIEHAPKDGTDILAYQPDCRPVAIYWDEAFGMAHNPCWVNCETGEHYGRFDAPFTHFMPMPHGPGSRLKTTLDEIDAAMEGGEG